MGVAWPEVVVDRVRLVKLPVRGEEFERRGVPHASPDGVQQQSLRIFPAADRDQLHARCEPGTRRSRIRDYVYHRPLKIKENADRESEIEGLAGSFFGTLEWARSIRVDQFPPGGFDTPERRMGFEGLQSCRQERSPIERSDAVQSGDHILEVVRPYRRPRVVPAMKNPAKIIERFSPLRFPPYHHIPLEPDEVAFIVEIDGAAIRFPIAPRNIEKL